MIRTLLSRFSSTCVRFPFLAKPQFLLSSYRAPSSLSLLQHPSSSLIRPLSGVFHFSLKMRKVKAKQLARKKVKLYKMKTHSGFKKRFWVTGSLNEKQFNFKSAGARHLMRNKTWQCKRRNRKMKTITTRGDIKRAQKLIPYYKRKKILR